MFVGIGPPIDPLRNVHGQEEEYRHFIDCLRELLVGVGDASTPHEDYNWPLGGIGGGKASPKL